MEETHYYPYGLSFDTYKAPGNKTNDVKYNSQFLEQNEYVDVNGDTYGLEWYDFAARSYDPQTGRWMQPDPMMQHASPYMAMGDNPASFTDPLGLWDGPGDEVEIVPDGQGSAGYAVVFTTKKNGERPPTEDEKLMAHANAAIKADGIPQTAWEKRNWNHYNDPANGQSHKSFNAADYYDQGEIQGASASAIPIAITLAAADGPLPIGDVIGITVIAAATAYDATQRKFITYTLKNPYTGQIYVGRSSGFGDPNSIMRNRYYSHHMRANGFGDPQLDRVAQGIPLGYQAIRGREQMVIDAYGGINSPLLANQRNGISEYNPAKPIFMSTATYMFGPVIK